MAIIQKERSFLVLLKFLQRKTKMSYVTDAEIGNECLEADRTW